MPARLPSVPAEPIAAGGPRRSPSVRAVPAPAVPGAAGAVRIREVPAVRRAMAILHHLARHAEGLGVSRIARDLEIIPSTCLHILRELVAARLVAFEPNGKLYRLGLGVLGLAREVSRQHPFIQVAQPRLQRFARDFHVSAAATQRDGEDMVVVAVATAAEGDAVAVGNRVPCLASASGRLIAAFSGWTGAQLQTRFERVRWQRAPDFRKWLREVRQAGERGHALDEGQFRLGITAIAAPVFGPDGTVSHTLTINVVSAQLDARRRATFIDAVVRTSAEIAAALEGRPGARSARNP